MRLIFWTDWFAPSIGGVEVFSARLLPALARMGHEITVVAGHHQADLPDTTDFMGVAVHRFPFHAALATRNLDQVSDLARAVSHLKRAKSPDLMHLNTLGPSVFFHLESVRAYSVPTLLTLHSPLTESTVSCQSISGRALRSADWVNCNSHALHRDLCRGIPQLARRSSVIHYGMEAPGLEPAPRPQPARVLAFGRLVPEKGFDIALRAFARVVRRLPETRFVLAGDGAARPDLEQLAAALGISAVVEFTGSVAPHDIPALLNTVSLVVVPSRWEEPFGLVALEAALMARPVVASRTGGLTEVVEHGRTGLLVGKEDPVALAEAIVQLVEHTAEADEMARRARARACERFSWPQCVGAYERLYEMLVASRHGEVTQRHE